MKVFYSDHFVLPLPEGHRFPMVKYSMLRERVAASGICSPEEMREPRPVSDEEILRAHERGYLRRVVAGTLTSKEMRRIGFPWSERMVERSRRASGGTLGACLAALEDGFAANLAGGTHHAFADRGEGYCVFNDSAIAARAVQAAGLVERVVVVDTDVHQGNGTAAILRGDPSVFTFSLHGAKNFPFRKEESDLDVALPDGADDGEFLEALESGLERALEESKAELAIYLAGADPYEGDRLGRLSVSKQGLAERDRLVLESCRSLEIPIVVTMAGGYARNVEDTVDVHFQSIHRAAALLLSLEKPQRMGCMEPVENSCVVVGAGISGLLAARQLTSAGWRVVVLERDREVGGRMATRRVGGGTFDYGAQFFTVRSERFEKPVEEWLEAGIVQEWTRGFADAEGRYNEDGYPRYRGSDGMSSIPEHLARSLDVRTGEQVVEANVRDGAWEVHTASGASVAGAAVLLTAPVPQSLAIIGSGTFVLPDGARERLGTISYAPCLALLALLDGPTDVPEPGGMQVKGEPLDWISDNRRKGISEAPGITIHAGPTWSRKHFETPEEEVTRSLLAFAGKRLDSDLSSKAVETSLTRWRYSWVTQSHPQPCLVASEDPPLLFAGDAFGGAKVEGAALSGLAAADHLLGR